MEWTSLTYLNECIEIIMLIIPAIDLKDGHCVRLKQGMMEDATVFQKTQARWRATGSIKVENVYIWLISTVPLPASR